MAGFHTTGVYTFNWDAIHVVDSAPHTSALVSLTGCCSKSQDLKLDVADIDFTKEEHTRFERRFKRRKFEKGYDFMDDRYKLWLEKFHSIKSSWRYWASIYH